MKKQKYAIVTDTSVHFEQDYKNKHKNLKFLPLPIIIEEKEYFFDEEIIDDEYFYKMIKENKVSTSQTSIGVIETKLNKYLKEYDKLIIACISKGLSNQYNSICNIVNNNDKFKNNVIVLDTMAMSELLKNIIDNLFLYLNDKNLNDKKEIKKLHNHVKNINKTSSFFFPMSLDVFINSGRLSKIAAKFFNVLKIFPVLCFENGKMDKYSKMRTYIKGIKKTFQGFKEKIKTNNIKVAFTKFNDTNIPNKIKNELKSLGFNKIKEIIIPKVLIAHWGKGLFVAILD